MYKVADEPRTADFHLFEMLDQHLQLESGLLQRKNEQGEAMWPLLAAYHQRFGALAQLQSYFAHPMASLPINNKMATFGSTAPASSSSH
jgi:hypothetical protein